VKPYDIQRSWQSWRPLTLLLLPLSGLYCLLVALRGVAFALGWRKIRRLDVPVVVVGNLTVGGTGKTPLVIWLAERLIAMGHRPGIITRGYGGQSDAWPCEVTAGSRASDVGDEAVLMQRRTNCPVYAGPSRWETGRRLLSERDCDIIISDDGLQHTALDRDLEIVVVDGERRFGNGLCLPAGPLRESLRRLQQVDLVIVNGKANEGEYAMKVSGQEALPLQGGEPRPLPAFMGEPLHAIAGIGHPERFFGMLREAGLKPVCHPFADHHPYREDELRRFSHETVLMTEKDGVKCELFAQPNYWYVPAAAVPDKGFQAAFEMMIKRLTDG
jgi:tetraacyldisaccharide 4'-kinase